MVRCKMAIREEEEILDPPPLAVNEVPGKSGKNRLSRSWVYGS